MSVFGFAFDVELLVAATRFGYVVAECPVEVAFARAGGLGRMRLGTLLHTLADLVRIYYRASAAIRGSTPASRRGCGWRCSSSASSSPASASASC
ncbi:MAG: hypothetical protein U0599_15725 [Vicinamibacteria bacterium]